MDSNNFRETDYDFSTISLGDEFHWEEAKPWMRRSEMLVFKKKWRLTDYIQVVPPIFLLLMFGATIWFMIDTGDIRILRILLFLIVLIPGIIFFLKRLCLKLKNNGLIFLNRI